MIHVIPDRRSEKFIEKSRSTLMGQKKLNKNLGSFRKNHATAQTVTDWCMLTYMTLTDPENASAEQKLERIINQILSDVTVADLNGLVSRGGIWIQAASPVSTWEVRLEGPVESGMMITFLFKVDDQVQYCHVVEMINFDDNKTWGLLATGGPDMDGANAAIAHLVLGLEAICRGFSKAIVEAGCTVNQIMNYAVAN
jgi:hypothetical protein